MADLTPELRENVVEAVARIIAPADWDFCDPNGRKLLIGSVPRGQRQIWCKSSIAKARKIMRMLGQ